VSSFGNVYIDLRGKRKRGRKWKETTSLSLVEEWGIRPNKTRKGLPGGRSQGSEEENPNLSSTPFGGFGLEIVLERMRQKLRGKKKKRKKKNSSANRQPE